MLTGAGTSRTRASPSGGERPHPTAHLPRPLPVPLLAAQPPCDAINHTWYDQHYGGRDSYLAALLPSPFYPGPWAVPTSWMVPVGTEDCGQTQDVCNGQLRPGSRYR